MKQAEYSCYVVLEDDSQVIRLYKNDRYYFEANIVETLIYGFTERYNVIAEAAKENPAMLADITDASGNEFYITRH